MTDPRDTQEDDLIGQVLQDTYRITRRIAEGGMGVVYEASHVRLSKKRYAVKVLISAIMHMPNVYARFQREAEIASELGHPNIVDVQDSNQTADGRAYIVMEYLEGEDMGAYLEQGPMPPREVARVMRQVASALQVAHDEGVVHRDIKPANIFLVDTLDGETRVKVLDFGISKITHSQSIVTAEQSLLGTVYYMSPEQAEGCIPDIDHLTDIFALGTICYQALSGLLPFNAPTMPGVIYQICHKEPEPLTELMPELPPAVDRVLARALAKEKADRYQRVEEFARELDHALAGMAEVKPSPPPREPERITAVDLLPNGSQPGDAVAGAPESPAQPVSQSEQAPAASDTEYLPLDQALHGGAGGAAPQPNPDERQVEVQGATSVVPVDEIFAARPITGPPETPAPTPVAPAASTGPLEATAPLAQAAMSATGPAPPAHTTISGAAGQSSVEIKKRSSLGRRLAWPLLIMFWVGLAVGIFMLASGPPEDQPEKEPAAAGQDETEAEPAHGVTTEDDPGHLEEPPARPVDRITSASAGPDAGEPLADAASASRVGHAPASETEPDVSAGTSPAMASVKHRPRSVKKPVRPRKARRPRKKRRKTKKKKQPIVGFDKL